MILILLMLSRCTDLSSRCSSRLTGRHVRDRLHHGRSLCELAFHHRASDGHLYLSVNLFTTKSTRYSCWQSSRCCLWHWAHLPRLSTIGEISFTGPSLLCFLSSLPTISTPSLQLIPFSIQIGTAVGIGLLTALAGATEIDLVVTGHYTIVKLGKITPEVMVTIAGEFSNESLTLRSLSLLVRINFDRDRPALSHQGRLLLGTVIWDDRVVELRR
jgi:hypothetical protein